ncbi:MULTISPECIES: hypothetical protein [unclassified Streptomyces]|uniref:hypothetical protein n=1 Tax=unclassified Streptomyces TaxID=2593676 RepID=UPI000DC76675|nr:MULTISPECIES: hypothetical protein [unclassified Streptomyces]AWZ05698.1 hypothetical protein DRB89_14720 [Streptomyces sp. ICC4]AWZ11947.1 hypothetical protein DRB96_06045 [Streptomyces sp. ICC1]
MDAEPPTQDENPVPGPDPSQPFVRRFLAAAKHWQTLLAALIAGAVALTVFVLGPGDEGNGPDRSGKVTPPVVSETPDLLRVEPPSPSKGAEVAFTGSSQRPAPRYSGDPAVRVRFIGGKYTNLPNGDVRPCGRAGPLKGEPAPSGKEMWAVAYADVDTAKHTWDLNMLVAKPVALLGAQAGICSDSTIEPTCTSESPCSLPYTKSDDPHAQPEKDGFTPTTDVVPVSGSVPGLPSSVGRPTELLPGQPRESGSAAATAAPPDGG